MFARINITEPCSAPTRISGPATFRLLSHLHLRWLEGDDGWMDDSCANKLCVFQAATPPFFFYMAQAQASFLASSSCLYFLSAVSQECATMPSSDFNRKSSDLHYCQLDSTLLSFFTPLPSFSAHQSIARATISPSSPSLSPRSELVQQLPVTPIKTTSLPGPQQGPS